MAIELDVVTNLNRATAREAAREAQQYFKDAGDGAGRDFGDGLSKGLTAKGPEVEKALNKVADASGKVIVEQAKLNELKEKGNVTDARMIAQAEKLAKAVRDEGSALSAANLALKDHDNAARDAEAATLALSDATDRARERFVGSADAINQATSATRALQAEEKVLQDLMRRGNTDRETLISQSNRVASARRAEKEAVKLAGDGYRELESASKSLAGTSTGLMGALSEAGGAIRGLGGIMTPVLLVGVGSALVEVAGVAASAAQALWLLPAAAGAAGAAFGTLKLATMGFSDALDAMGDPEKFAAALKALSPNAQQAALSIQALMPSLKGLQQATQDALFLNVGPTLNRLTDQFLPTIQDMTTGIASAFNTAFQGVADQLMTPQTQQAIQAFTTNVASAFQQLAPAAAPFTKAIADIMAVGSGFLPDLAKAATDAAVAFSTFITEAKQSGDLKKWIGEGLDTLKQLGGIAIGLAEAFMELAPTGRDVLPQIADMLTDIKDIMPAIGAAALLLGPPIGLWAEEIKRVTDAFDAVKGVVQGVYDFAKPILENFRELIVAAMGPLGVIIDQAQKLGIIGDSGKGGGAVGAGATVSKTPPGLPGAGIGTGIARPVGTGIGSTTLAANPTPGGWSTPAGNPYASTSKPGGGSGSTPPPFIDPSKFAVGNPLAGMPAPSAIADPQAVYEADSRALTAANNLSQGKLALAVLEAKGNATQQELLTAKNNLAEQERALYDAQFKDLEARQGKMAKASSDLQSIFAPLDQDFGISGGIPGIVKNLVTFLGNTALAGAIASSPMLQAAALAMVSPKDGAASPTLGAPSSGSALGSPGGGFSDAALLANVPAGRYSQTGNADLTQGLADCSSSVEDLVNIMDGRPTGGRSMATGNAAEWLPAHGFVPGMGGPGDFRVGYNSGHMQATLPGGTPFNWGSDAAAANRGVGGTGADDPAFTSHYYRPVGASGSGGATGLSGATGLGSSPAGGVVPVYVTNLGGALGAPAAIPPAGQPPASGPSPSNLGPSSLAPPAGVPGLYSPENTNPGLNNPAAPGGGPSWANPALPAGIPGGGGQGPVLGSAPQGPGAGASAGFNTGIAPQGGGGPGLQLGGAGFDGAMMAAGALDLMAPGAGQAAQIGIKLGKRAIEYGGQVAGIGASGLAETFLPSGSALGNFGNSWFGKIAGGVAGARPAKDNMAGKGGATPPQQGQPGQGDQQGQPGQPPITVNYTNNQATEDRAGKDLTNHLSTMNSSPGPGNPRG